MPDSPAAAAGLAVSLVLGVAGASLLARLALRHNLRWSFALIPIAPALAIGGALPLARPLAFGLLVASLRCAWLVHRAEWMATLTAAEARRRARAALSLRDLFRIERRARTHDVAVDYPLGFEEHGREVRIAFGGSGGRHALLLGASGTGKSSTLVWITTRHIVAGFGCVVIDMKGDTGLVERLRVEALIRGHPFYLWSLDGRDRWNPLARGNASERKDKLIATERFSEPHYKRMYERYLLNVFRVLEASGGSVDLERAIWLLDPDALLGALRELPDERLADDVGRYLDRLSPDQRRHLGGLADRLSLLLEAGHGRYLVPGQDDRDLIDPERLLAGGGVAVFSLNSSRYPETAPMIGNLLLQDLKAACGSLEQEPWRRRPALIAIDEFSALESDQVVGLFQRARSAACSLLVATQEVADLRRVGPSFDEQVIGNVELIIAGRQNNPASADLVSALAGSEEGWHYSFAVEHGLGTVRPSGRATRRWGSHRLVATDTVMRLGVGRAVLIEKNPHRVELVSLIPAGEASRLCPDPALRAWLSIRSESLRAEASAGPSGAAHAPFASAAERAAHG